MIDGRTRLVGVMGWPVAHSLSPAMHNAAFEALGLNWCYVPLPVHPDHVGRALVGLRALGFVGANVTIPHKQVVIPHLAHMTPAAQAIAAVNTLWFDPMGDLCGDNTDAAGFLESLREADVDPAGMTALILGAGGAARAVAYALGMAHVRRVLLHNRTRERALSLVQDIRSYFTDIQYELLTAEELRQVAHAADLIINCTSVGMWPQVDACPWPEDLAFSPRAVAVDLIYRPRKTRFLARAEASGATIINGVGMLVHQGAAAFRLWTDMEPPVDVMRRALLEALGETESSGDDSE